MQTLKPLKAHLYMRPKRKCIYKAAKNLITLQEAQKARSQAQNSETGTYMLSEFANFRRSGAVSAPPLCFVYPRQRTTAARNNERARCSRGSFSQYAQHYLLIFYKPQH
jgi:hypothetical protein